jgi:FkbM family methyltransferase
MSLLNTLHYITHHPLNRQRKGRALLDFVKWQIGSRLVPGRVVCQWVEGARMVVASGDTGLTGNIYCGLHEFTDMAYVLHVLRPNDLFVDIGANVGSYTLLACAARQARGYAFEPVPATFAKLMDNIRINNLLGRIDARNIGVSDQAGQLMFSADQDTTNHVVANGEANGRSIQVDVLPLDSVLDGEAPSVIKLDVEGFEMPALRGARATLSRQELHSIVIELNGSGERYGFKDEDIVRELTAAGFSACDYDPFTRDLRVVDGRARNDNSNALFVRGVPEVQERLRRAPKILIKDVLL